MNNTRYLLGLLSLAIVVASTTFFVQRQRVRQAEAQVIREAVALNSDVVNNQQQLEQVVTIQQQVRKRQPLSNEQVSQLTSVVDGPLDSILQAKALATLSVVARLGSLSKDQRSQVSSSVQRALLSPDVLVRSSAAGVLGRLGDQQAVTALLPLLNDPDEIVRDSARKSLERLEKQKADPK